MPHASLFTDRVSRLSRRLAWPLAFSLAVHVAAFLGWHSPVFYASIGHHRDAIHARLTPAPPPDSASPLDSVPPPASAPPLALEEPPREPDAADPPDKPRPAPVAPEAEPRLPRAEPPPSPAELLPQQAEPFQPQADPSAYLPSGALDAPAVPIGVIEPDFPDDPQAQQLEGRVVLRVLISEHGAVDRVIVEDAGSLPRLFSDSAAVAFLAARFHPALRAGVPVKSQILVEVRYGPAP